MHDKSPFDYAVVRVVPSVEREEFINAGIILFCHAHDFLDAWVDLDEQRLRALAPDVDLELVRTHLAAIPLVCRGGANSGPIGALTQRERWHWLVAPRSTILQVSQAHVGLCDTPNVALRRLADTIVRVRPSLNAG